MRCEVLLLTVLFFLTLFLTNEALPKKENREFICKLPQVKGYCRALLPRWRYDPITEKCVEFTYGGCGGNENNFEREEDCIEFCGGIS